VLGPDRDTDRTCQPVRADRRDRVLGDCVADAFGGPERFVVVGFRQDREELLAAPASERVSAAKGLGHHAGEAGEGHVAGGVSVLVVDLLEVIDIQKQDRQWASMAACALKLGSKAEDQRAMIGNSGQRVGRCQRGEHALLDLGSLHPAACGGAETKNSSTRRIPAMAATPTAPSAARLSAPLVSALRPLCARASFALNASDSGVIVRS
jgi:hypothetical protein